MNRFSFLLAAVLLSSGCTVTHTIPAEFDRAYAREQLQPGPNIVKGSALIRQQAGGVVTCAGLPVYLLPQTSYSMERIRALYGNGDKGFRAINAPKIKFVPDEPDYLTLSRKTMCNAQGFFEFSDVADGDFFVITGIKWTVGYSDQGGTMMHGVYVSGGEVAEVVLSP